MLFPPCRLVPYAPPIWTGSEPLAGGAAAVKLAVTLRLALMISEQGPVPLHAPPQPRKLPPLGASVTVAPWSSAMLQAPPGQLR